MIPLIIHGGTIDDRAKHIADNYPEGKFVITHVTAEKSSILIGQIHELIKNLAVTSRLPRLIWIEEAGQLTIPAQNALLKILEEPPANTQFILSVSNPRSLLPTISSRCRLMKITATADVPLDGTALADIKKALPASAGDRILAADSLGRKREPLLLWTQNCLSDLEQKIKTEKSPKPLSILTRIAGLVHSTYLDLQTNVSVTLTMQNLFLSLPHTKN